MFDTRIIQGQKSIIQTSTHDLSFEFRSLSEQKVRKFTEQEFGELPNLTLKHFECRICYEDYDDHTTKVPGVCRDEIGPHVFCFSCTVKTIQENSKCPLCRENYFYLQKFNKVS